MVQACIRAPGGEGRVLTLLRYRKLHKILPRLSNVVEHPSLTDRMDLFWRLTREKRESERCQKHPGNSGEMEVSAVSPEHPRVDHDHDIATLRSAIQAATQHGSSPGRLVGIVWASSGNAIAVDPIVPQVGGQVNAVKQDWALIKLFPEVRYANVLGANVLRPDRTEPQRVLAIKPWLKPNLSFRVSKRGRTSDLTIGEVNGCYAIQNGPRREFIYTIVSTAFNRTLFGMPGDSGSWIMDKCGQLVGLLWGSHRGTGSSGFTPAWYLSGWIQKMFEEASGREPAPPRTLVTIP